MNCLLRAGIEGKPGAESARRIYLHYEILEHPDGSPWELGRSETGVTYKARDINLDTIVALKVVAAELSDRPEARARFQQAVQAAAQVHHPNFVQVFHFGTVVRSEVEASAENFPAAESFYTMEYVEGESLETRVTRHGPLRPLLAVEVAIQVARALSEAEKRGLPRRDLPPSNVMLTSDQPDTVAATGGRAEGWVKVIGLSLNKGPDPVDANASHVRSDLCSLGEILCLALSGKSPAEDGALLEAKLRAGPVPPTVMVLLEELLDRDEEKPPSLPAVIGLLENCRQSLAEAEQFRRRRRRYAYFSVLALSLAAIVFSFYWQPWVSAEDKSIAVLPFRNLSQNQDDAFFAEGVRDDIVSRLVKIRDLKVMSRLRLDALPAGQTPDFRAIGRELGARNLLTGSLRRAGDRVFLEVSLLEAGTGRQIWSEKYDRKLKDAINLQGELASNVAAALDARLSARERVAVRASTTLNPDAYVLYLRARKLEESITTQVSSYEAAATLYRQAIALDPGFALAHARLAVVLGMLYRFRGPSEELHNQAASAAREALRLEPDLGQAHLAQGMNLYRIERDFESALSELEIARKLLPNDAEAGAFIALIHRRQGRWREARSGLEQAHQLAPEVRRYEEELHATACLLRDWPAAARHIERALALTPGVAELMFERALVDYWQNGHLDPLQKVAALIASGRDVRGDTAWARWDVAMVARDFVAADQAIDSFPFETLPTVLGAPVPKSYLRGCTWLARGDRNQAQAAFEMARPAMEAETIARPGDAMRHARLGLLYAYLGKKAEALREGERAVEITPVSEDAVEGHQWLCNLALIRAWVGETAESVSMIESLLRQPGCVSPLNEASLTLSDLRLRWQWDPLRQDPHFQRILAAPEPRTVF